MKFVGIVVVAVLMYIAAVGLSSLIFSGALGEFAAQAHLPDPTRIATERHGPRQARTSRQDRGGDPGEALRSSCAPPALAVAIPVLLLALALWR